MTRIDVRIPMSEGVSQGTLHVPDGEGPWPGVLVFTDIFGPREVFSEMGDRLAGLGYVALIPDVYYREGDYPAFDVPAAFGVESERNRLFALAGTLSNERVIADGNDYADFLLARPEVSGTAIGAHGYCMGGRLALVAAGGMGGKMAAAASFHAAGIAVADDPNSPHQAADQIDAAVFVAGSDGDPGFTAEQAELLDSALSAAGVEHTVESWPGGHGFAVADMPVYDAGLDERHWRVLSDLYGARLS
jgi:carboxymethylenebutenolidase